MAEIPSSNTSLPSTKWEWRYVKITRRSAAEDIAPKAAFRSGRLTIWPRRKPLTLTVRYWGGAECRVQVRTRGRTFYFSGHDAIFDVMRRVWGER